jgi:sigma-54 specific flagellar transcriptional regulator A
MTNQAGVTQQVEVGSVVHAPESPMAGLVRTARRIGASDAPVLIVGEAGTGKETIGRVLHASGSRRSRPFAAVSCGGVSEALLETALFGRSRGGDGPAPRPGAMALAEGGTLFLDEVGELPPTVQLKLLHVLRDLVYEPVGAVDPVPADFRLIASTSRDLAADVEAGRFRRDLYFRVAVCSIQVPPLRDRGEDATLLFDHFLTLRGEARTVEPAVYEALRTHRWPGNVRELLGLVERLAICAEGETIRLSDLPPALHRTAPLAALRPARTVAAAALHPVRPPPAELSIARELAAVPPGSAGLPGPSILAGSTIDLTAMLRGLEDSFIDAALARTGGNKKAAADLLGLHRTTLVEKLRRRRRVEGGEAGPPEDLAREPIRTQAP